MLAGVPRRDYSARAADAAPPVELQDRWISTPLIEKQGADGVVRARAFERLVVTGESTFPVANIIYYRIPKPKSADARLDLDQVAEKTRQGMGFDAWKLRREKSARVYEAYWNKTGRFVRLYLTQDAESFSMSVATFRVLFAWSSAVESELIQRQLSGALDRRVPWLEKATTRVNDSFWRLLGLSPVYAGDCPQCAPTDYACIIANASCLANRAIGSVDGLGNQIGGLGNQLGGVSGQLGGLSGSIGGLSGTVNNAAGNLGAAAGNLGNSVNNAAGTLGNAGANLGNNINNAAGNVSGAINNGVRNLGNQVQGGKDFIDSRIKGLQDYGDSRIRGVEEYVTSERKNVTGFIDKTLSSENVFRIGFFTAAGLTLGAAVASAAVSGLSKLMDLFVNAVTGAKTEEEMLKKFEVARQGWEGATKAASAIEQSMDGLLMALAAASKQAPEALLKFDDGKLRTKAHAMQDRMEILKKRKLATLEKADELAPGSADREKLCGQYDRANEDYTRVEQQYESMVGVRDFLIKNPHEKLCRDLGQSLSALRMTEEHMQNLRMDLLSSFNAFERKRSADHSANYEKLQIIKDKQVALERYLNAVDAANKNDKRESEELEKALVEYSQKKEIQDCEYQRMAAANGGKSSVSRNFIETQRYKYRPAFMACLPSRLREKRANIEFDAKDAKKEAARHYHETIAKLDLVGVNTSSTNRATKAYDRWYEQLLNEQACQANPDDKSACSEQSTGGKNLAARLHQVLIKGTIALGQLCPQPR